MRGAGWAPLLRRREDFLDHLPQAFEAVAAVASLVPIALACHNEFTGIGDAACLFCQQPLTHILRQRRRLANWPSQADLAADLVDVLAAGAGTACHFDFKFAQRYSDVARDIQ